MSKLLESLIARGRRVRRPREQREVAFGLADLSTHTEVHVRLVQKGGVKSLLKLLEKSPDQEAQRFSALALGNVASTAENRVPMVDEGALRPLIAYIRNEDGDVIGRQYSALALGNIASEIENHEEIVKLDGIDALITLLKRCSRCRIPRVYSAWRIVSCRDCRTSHSRRYTYGWRTAASNSSSSSRNKCPTTEPKKRARPPRTRNSPKSFDG